MLGAGAALLWGRGGVGRAASFSAAALLAGTQWYGWTYVHTGDPVFPMLFGLLPYPDSTPWNAAQAALFRHWATAVEAPLPRGPLDVALYPLLATFVPPDGIDSGRTGLGLAPVLLAPFALVGLWRHRRSPALRRWLPALVVLVGFYLSWSAFGASQRVRHYLPLLPLLLALLLAAATRAGALRPLAVGLGALLLVQAAGQAVFVRDAARSVVQGESRDAYLARKVGWAFAVPWANDSLPPGALVAINARQWDYLLRPRAWLLNPGQQALVEVRPDSVDPALYWRQLRRAGVTHLLLAHLDLDPAEPLRPDAPDITRLTRALLEAGCVETLAVLHGPDSAPSRTLASGPRPTVPAFGMALRPDSCPFEVAGR